MDVLTLINQKKEIDDVTLAHWVELGKIKVIDIQGQVVPSASVKDSKFEYYKLLDDSSVLPTVLLYNHREANFDNLILPLKYGFQSYESAKHDTFNPAFVQPITNLKWIHDIERLKQKLQDVLRFEDLEVKKYDVNSYYLYNLKDKDKTALDYLRWLELYTHIPSVTREYIKIHAITEFNCENLIKDIHLNYSELSTTIFKYASKEDVTRRIAAEVYKLIGYNERSVEFWFANQNKDLRIIMNNKALSKLNSLKETKDE